MNASVDHAAEARRILAEGEGVIGKLRDARGRGEIVNADDYGKKAAGCWAQAQVHATLALVEQQRIANLITVAGWVMDSRIEDVGFDLDKLRVGVAGEVWEGLGLS